MYKTKQDVREALEQRLKGPVLDNVWDDLADQEYPDSVLEADCDVDQEEAFGTLARRARVLCRRFTGDTQANESKEQYIPTRFTAARSKAVAFLLAREARSRPDVRKFRTEVLAENLLTAEEVPSWIERQQQIDRDAGAAVGTSDPDREHGVGNVGRTVGADRQREGGTALR